MLQEALLDSKKEAEIIAEILVQKVVGKNVTLLYPKTAENIDESKLSFRSDDGVLVKVKFIDLYDKNFISNILNSIIEKEKV